MQTVLIANRGEIACRIIQTAREMGLRTVAVYSDPDATARHVEMADEAVPLGGASPADTYLHRDKLLDAAALTGADAVHPGYGFLAESAAFAQSCVDAGITWVGPAPEVIAAMGDKLHAKELMDRAGVPVLTSYAPDGVPPDAYPVLVKAAAGGGGKGMRLVEDADGLLGAIAAARRESAAAFGDDRVFIERYLSRPHHIEVQILGDHHGTVVHLGERECSVQRRHQKIIEESPSPLVDEAFRERICGVAVAGAEAIGYSNAGTFEFVVSGDRQVAFLEVNTRLQVEHPVTEMAWGLRDGGAIDLVRLQLLVAGGAPIPFSQDDVVLRRHAVEARIYAEDPAAGFLPATGDIVRWDVPRHVRCDSGVKFGDQVTSHYDPMLAKVIAAAPSRREAVLSLASSLERSRIHGVTTNRDFLIGALRNPAFLGGDYDTGFVADHASIEVGRDRGIVELAAVAAALHQALARYRSSTVHRSIPLAWRNNRSQPHTGTYQADTGEAVTVAYEPRRGGSFSVQCGDIDDVAIIYGADRDTIDVEVGRRRRRYHVDVVGRRVYVTTGAASMTLTEVLPFRETDAQAVTGGLTAPMPGTVVSVAVRRGDEVAAGALLVVLEAMKMEHRITAPTDGVVTAISVAPGDMVAAGDPLAVVARAAL